MSFFDKVKNAGTFLKVSGQKTKLKAEIALIDRDIKTRQQVFGCDMYDLMEQKKTFGGKTESETKVIEVFEVAAKDIAIVNEKKDAKLEEIKTLDAKATATPKDANASMSDKMKTAGTQITDAAQKAKLKGEIVLLDREIKTRKQMFGVEIYNTMVGIEGWTAEDSEVGAVFEGCKKDVSVHVAKKDVKLEEINVLDAESGAAQSTAAQSQV